MWPQDTDLQADPAVSPFSEYNEKPVLYHSQQQTARDILQGYKLWMFELNFKKEVTKPCYEERHWLNN